MVLDPTVLRPRALPDLPAGSQVLAVPFADLIVAALATRAVELAKRAHAVRVVLAVCEGGPPCELFGTIVIATAAHNDIRLTIRYPSTGGAVAARPGEDRRMQGVGWPEQFALADLELTVGAYSDAVRASRHQVRRLEGAADGNVPGPAGNHGQYTHAGVLTGVLSMLPGPPGRIWLPHDPATRSALDGAIRLQGWPSVIATIATTADQLTSRDVSALDPYLSWRITADDRVEALDPDKGSIAQRSLTVAGMPSNHEAHADGVGGLLTASGGGRPVNTDLALVPLPTFAHLHRRGPWARAITHRPDTDA